MRHPLWVDCGPGPLLRPRGPRIACGLGPLIAFPHRMENESISRTGFRRWTMAGLPRWVRRTAVLLVGTLLLVLGIALIVLPGPAVVVIPAAVGLLATEFEWAQKWRVGGEAVWRRVRDASRRRASAQEEERRPM
ncbi:MAG: hypothetical protein CL936_13230 [Deltaproteobacteria bacterium]|nr:hypothetical protein [Deltaproteobacteria bacterium]